MKKYSLGIGLLILFFILVGCATEEETSVSTQSTSKTDIVSQSLISIPSALSSASSQANAPASFYSASQAILSTAPSAEDAPVWAVYEGIRANIAALETWTGLIVELTDVIYTIVGSSSSGSWDSGETSGLSRISWGSGSDQGYTYKMELFYGAAFTKGFEACLTLNTSAKTAKGVYTWYFSVVPDENNNDPNARFQFVFDATVEPKVMEIKVTGLNGGTSEPEKAWIKVTQSSDHVINLWGNYYFPSLDMIEDSTADALEARNYVFAATGYDEIGQSSSNQNKAILQLALPLSSISVVSGIWNDASVSAIFVERVKEIWASQTNTSEILSWTGWGAGTLPPNIADYTYSNITSILEWARDSGDPDAANLDDLIFVLKLVNPAYFNANGFAGTCMDQDQDGTCEQGTESTVPDGFGDLDITAVAGDVASPQTVRDMTVTFLP